MIPGELYIFGLVTCLVLVLLGLRYATSNKMNKGLFGFVCLVSSYIMIGSMAYISLDTICFSYGNFVLDPCIGKFLAVISFVICIFSLIFYLYGFLNVDKFEEDLEGLIYVSLYILSNVVFLYLIPSIFDKLYEMFNGYNEEVLTYINDIMLDSHALFSKFIVIFTVLGLFLIGLNALIKLFISYGNDNELPKSVQTWYDKNKKWIE